MSYRDYDDMPSRHERMRGNKGSTVGIAAAICILVCLLILLICLLVSTGNNDDTKSKTDGSMANVESVSVEESIPSAKIEPVEQEVSFEIPADSTPNTDEVESLVEVPSEESVRIEETADDISEDVISEEEILPVDANDFNVAILDEDEVPDNLETEAFVDESLDVAAIDVDEISSASDAEPLVIKNDIVSVEDAEEIISEETIVEIIPDSTVIALRSLDDYSVDMTLNSDNTLVISLPDSMDYKSSLSLGMKVQRTIGYPAVFKDGMLFISLGNSFNISDIEPIFDKLEGVIISFSRSNDRFVE